MHFDDGEAASRFASRYPDLRCSTAVGSHAYAVRQRGGAYFWLDDGPAYRWPHGGLSASATAFLADAVATHALLRALPGAVSLHAAALRFGMHAFAITGLSTAGKSTTALACAAAGASLFSDERCIVRSGLVIPYPRAINVRAGGLQMLIDGLPESDIRRRLEPHRGKDWESVRFTSLFGDRPFPQPAPLRAIFAITGFANKTSIRAIAPSRMLPVAKSGALCGAQGLDRIARLLALLNSAACYEMELGPPFESAQAILREVNS